MGSCECAYVGVPHITPLRGNGIRAAKRIGRRKFRPYREVWVGGSIGAGVACLVLEWSGRGLLSRLVAVSR